MTRRGLALILAGVLLLPCAARAEDADPWEGLRDTAADAPEPAAAAKPVAPKPAVPKPAVPKPIAPKPAAASPAPPSATAAGGGASAVSGPAALPVAAPKPAPRPVALPPASPPVPARPAPVVAPVVAPLPPRRPIPAIPRPAAPAPAPIPAAMEAQAVAAAPAQAPISPAPPPPAAGAPDGPPLPARPSDAGTRPAPEPSGPKPSAPSSLAASPLPAPPAPAPDASPAFAAVAAPDPVGPSPVAAFGALLPITPAAAAPLPPPPAATAEPAPEPAPAEAAAPAPAEAAPRPPGRTDIYPVTLVRRLQRLQDLIASGSTAGIAQQRAMIEEMDAAFAAADPSVWQDPANARALVMYFLGGGNPAVLRTILAREPKPAIDEKLITGSLFYLEGREELALAQLGEIDARKLPNGIGGQIALAQAALTVRADPAKAARLLEVARLLMPGTLVDEAALRRAVLVAAQAGDLDQFERLSGQYFSRFRHSAYAGNFRQRFAAALSRMNVLATPEGLARLDALLAPLDEEARREVFLLVSRAAIVEGKTALATAAAERAMVLAPVASRDAERARVYLGAAQAASADRYKAAEAALKAIDRARLDPSDQALLEAATRTAELIRRADETPAAATSAPADSPAAPVVVASARSPRLPAQEAEKPPAALARAQAKLGEIDALLKDAPR